MGVGDWRLAAEGVIDRSLLSRGRGSDALASIWEGWAGTCVARAKRPMGTRPHQARHCSWGAVSGGRKGEQASERGRT
jgi:hypothetical protein